MSRLAADTPRSWGLYEQLRADAEVLDQKLAGKPVHPGAVGRERERLIKLAQLRAGYPVEVSGFDVPEDALPPVPGGRHRPVVVYPDSRVTLNRRPRGDMSELMYEWAESDSFGTPADYATYLYRKYYM